MEACVGGAELSLSLSLDLRILFGGFQLHVRLQLSSECGLIALVGVGQMVFQDYVKLFQECPSARSTPVVSQLSWEQSISSHETLINIYILMARLQGLQPELQPSTRQSVPSPLLSTLRSSPLRPNLLPLSPRVPLQPKRRSHPPKHLLSNKHFPLFP